MYPYWIRTWKTGWYTSPLAPEAIGFRLSVLRHDQHAFVMLIDRHPEEFKKAI